MVIQQGFGEKDGKLCFLEIEMDTGKYHYYPIRVKIESSFNPNMGIIFPNPYLYVDREREE